MKFELKDFQQDTVEKSWEFISNKGEFNFQSPTGTGKTLVTAAIVNQFIEKANGHNYTMLHFSPSTGNLYEQNYRNFSKYKLEAGFLNYNTNLFLSSLPSESFQKNKVHFFGWDKLIKVNSKITLNQERSNFWDVFKKTLDKGLKFLIIVDEQHIGSNSASKATQSFLNEINTFHSLVHGELPVYIRTSATFNENFGDTLHHSTTYQQAKEEELVKKDILVNDFTHITTSPNNEIEQLVHAAIDKRDQISLAYSNRSKVTREGNEPLIIIQLENGNKEVTKKTIQKAIESHPTFSTKHAAVWLDDTKSMFDGSKISKQDIENNNDIKLLIFKQAIATGWDVPRASVWVKFRKNMNQSFEVQTLGRILRNQFLKYFNDDLIDNGYVYTNHEDAKPRILNTFGGSEVAKKVSIKMKKSIELRGTPIEKMPFKKFNKENSVENYIEDFNDIIDRESKYKELIYDEVSSNKISLLEWEWESPRTSIIKSEDIDIKPSFIEVQQHLFESNRYTLLNKYFKYKSKIFELTSNNEIIFNYIDNFIRSKAIEKDDGDFINMAYKFFYNNVGSARNFVIELIEFFNKITLNIEHSSNDFQPKKSVEINENYINKELAEYSEDNFLFYDTEYLIDGSNEVFQSNQEKLFYSDIKSRKKNKIKLDSEIEYILYNITDPKQYYYSEYVGTDFKIHKYFPDFIVVTVESVYILDTKTIDANNVNGSPKSIYKMKKFNSFLESDEFEGKNIKFGYVFIEDGVWKVVHSVNNNEELNVELLESY